MFTMITRLASPEEPTTTTADAKRRVFFMAIREALRIALRAVEEYGDLPHSFETQQERRERRER